MHHAQWCKWGACISPSPLLAQAFPSHGSACCSPSLQAVQPMEFAVQPMVFAVGAVGQSVVIHCYHHRCALVSSRRGCLVMFMVRFGFVTCSVWVAWWMVGYSVLAVCLLACVFAGFQGWFGSLPVLSQGWPVLPCWLFQGWPVLPCWLFQGWPVLPCWLFQGWHTCGTGIVIVTVVLHR